MPRHNSLLVVICLLLIFVVIAISSGPALAHPGGKNNNLGGKNNNQGGTYNNPGGAAAPELDPGIAGTGVALLAMGMLILIDRRRARGPHTSA